MFSNFLVAVGAVVPLIVGWAHTRFGKSEAPDTTALMAEVAGPALAHAGVTADQQALFRRCTEGGSGGR